MKWVPKDIKVDRRNPEEGKTTHLITCAEDGQVILWDVRFLYKEARSEIKGKSGSAGVLMMDPIFKI